MNLLPQRRVAEIALRVATETIDGICNPPWGIEFKELPDGGCAARWIKPDGKTIAS